MNFIQNFPVSVHRISISIDLFRNCFPHANQTHEWHAQDEWCETQKFAYFSLKHYSHWTVFSRERETGNTLRQIQLFPTNMSNSITAWKYTPRIWAKIKNSAIAIPFRKRKVLPEWWKWIARFTRWFTPHGRPIFLC